MKIENNGLSMTEKVAKFHKITLAKCVGIIYGNIPEDPEVVLYWSTTLKMWCVDEDESKNLTIDDVQQDRCTNNNKRKLA